MSNPKRCTFNDEVFIGIPTVDEEDKVVIIRCYRKHREYGFKTAYERAMINLYMAPDVCIQYTNGNTSKHEFHRYQRWIFRNLKLKHEEVEEEYTRLIYHYDFCKNDWFELDDPEMYTDIPIGKLADMTYKEVKQYEKENITEFASSLTAKNKQVESGPDFHC